ncbi:MAG: hypothetical protein IMW97_07655 [Firmicutes bacterium]|nr:hypothetical protein [Candidatus Fermentithermobacillaceae bacterium]
MISAPRGNLVKNPGFELGLAFWETPPTLTDLTLRNVRVTDLTSHSGLAMLGMGVEAPGQPAAVYQDVCVAPGRIYQLSFAVAGAAANPADLLVEVRWLDADGEDLGLAYSALVPSGTIGAAGTGGWTLHTGVTDEAPMGARFARISLTKGAGTAELFVDDVFFCELA